ncbi:hypothetical protein [Roseivirga thermotolerans]|uniref:Uncharacterized protein n=1 Tax=Roseivirga thermotolerans TaxID=1758176 RepID=A0ABQ3I4J9_9BACT|nr:hypothetical protein [Roseivirga thermotolerans]GHE57137.1 hypothetical protein GCM10011340_10200 [Roseivirga thermotolerans]
MSNRLFLLDKNYILKQAQKDQRASLQLRLMEIVKEGYFLVYNPLRLPDTTSEQVRLFQTTELDVFDELYDILAGIYRYQIGDNQLELLFDGSSHYDKYVTDWTEAFCAYTQELCTKKNFILAALELTVFRSPEKRIELAQNRMKVAIFEHFELKVYKHKGIQAYKSKSA